MYQSAQFKNPRNFLDSEDREVMMPMSPEESGESFLNLWKKGAMNAEALAQAAHKGRMGREKDKLGLEEEFAARADGRALTGKYQDNLWNSTTQLGNNYMNLVGRLA
jgi:hypothetical protein